MSTVDRALLVKLVGCFEKCICQGAGKTEQEPGNRGAAVSGNGRQGFAGEVGGML